MAEPIQYPYFAPGIRYGVFAAGRVEDGTKEGDIAADWFLLPAEPEDLARDLDEVFAKKELDSPDHGLSCAAGGEPSMDRPGDTPPSGRCAGH